MGFLQEKMARTSDEFGLTNFQICWRKSDFRTSTFYEYSLWWQTNPKSAVLITSLAPRAAQCLNWLFGSRKESSRVRKHIYGKTQRSNDIVIKISISRWEIKLLTLEQLRNNQLRHSPSLSKFIESSTAWMSKWLKIIILFNRFELRAGSWTVGVCIAVSPWLRPIH